MLVWQPQEQTWLLSVKAHSLLQAFIDHTRALLVRPLADTAEHDVNEPWRRAALLRRASAPTHPASPRCCARRSADSGTVRGCSYADEDEMFGRTRLALAPLDKGGDAAPRVVEGEEEGALDRLRMVYEMEWPLGTLLLTPQVMHAYNQLFVFLLRVKRAQAELQHAWHETQSGRYGRAIASTLHKLAQSSRHMTGMWALRSEMAQLVNNLLYYLQCDVIDAQFEALRAQVRDSDSFETVRAAHARFLERVSNEALLRNKLAFSTVTAILRIVLKFARRMAQWRQIDKGQVEAAASLRRFRVSDSAAAVRDAYLGFPITVAGEVPPPFRSFRAGRSARSRWSCQVTRKGCGGPGLTAAARQVSVITGYSADREVTLYRALKRSRPAPGPAACMSRRSGNRHFVG